MKKLNTLLLSYFLMAGTAFAAEDPFDAVNTIGDKILSALTGKFAILFVSIVIGITGYLIINGNVPKKRGYEIIGGAIVIYSSATIGAWLFSS